MSKSKLRTDKTCLNCNYVVQNRFCPNCGQENVDTRKTFHHLFVHFFEDLTHYENSFWKTIKNLLFKPGSLTIEYLSGKRLSYLAPIRLYIFISFITFFVIAALPDNKENDIVKFKNSKTDKKYYDEEHEEKNYVKLDSAKQQKNDTNIPKAISEIEKLRKMGILQDKVADSMVKYIKDDGKEKSKETFLQLDYNSVAEMDSVRKSDAGKVGSFQYWIQKKLIPIRQKYKDKELSEKLLESMTHNFPKTLFVYMPLFAFVLWLFHNKRRWFYFDHGIFTLHYFSFLLLSAFLLALINYFFDFFDNSILSFINKIIKMVIIGWMVYYFFPAHHRFYKETRFVSLVKSAILFFINIIMAAIVLVFFVFYSFINIH